MGPARVLTRRTERQVDTDTTARPKGAWHWARIFAAFAFVYLATTGALCLVFRPESVALPMLLATVLAALATTDWRILRLPDAGTLAVFVLGLVALADRSAASLAATVLGAAAVFAVFWLVGEVFFRWRGVDGLGIGDAKLIAAAVPWVGIAGIAPVVGLAATGGLVFVILRGEPRTAAVPFGVFLSYAILVVSFYI